LQGPHCEPLAETYPCCAEEMVETTLCIGAGDRAYEA
jgi:hypothetical protein